jgi:nucleotide-binding universal stress UspA family protein
VATSFAVPSRIRVKNILFATDFSEISHAALYYACRLAKWYGSKVFVAHAVPPEPYLSLPIEPVPWDVDMLWHREQREMKEFLTHTALQQVPHEEILQRGELWQVIAGAVEKNHIDLIVAGTHGRHGLKKVVLGSAAEKIFRQSQCPVLTVGPEAVQSGHLAWEPKQVLFATDFSKDSLCALPHALSLAEENQAMLVLVNVAPLVPYQYKRSMEESTRQKLEGLLPASHACAADFIVAFDFPAEGILETARDRRADLIVLGVSRRPAVGLTCHLPWSVASDVVSSAPCPVLTVRG